MNRLKSKEFNFDFNNQLSSLRNINFHNNLMGFFFNKPLSF